MSTSRQRSIASVAVFAALIIASAVVSIPSPIGGVPIVLQNAFCILAGLVLGPRRGFYAVGVVMLLGMVGLPVLAGGRSVLAALSGPTVGYLVGYLLSPLLAGSVSALFLPRRANVAALTAGMAVAAITGFAIQYACGIVGLVARAGQTFGTALAAQTAFLPGMAIKLVVITIVASAVVRALPSVRPTNVSN